MTRLISFFGCALLVVLCAFGVWIASLGYYGKASHWLADAYELKERAAEDTLQGRVLVVSGSNSLFGLSSAYLSKLLARPVVNLAGHASLSLEYHGTIAISQARQGDVVVMPLEFSLLERGPKLTQFESENLETWGHKYLLSRPYKLVEFFRYSSLTSTISRLRERRAIPRVPSDQVELYVGANTERGMSQWMGYSIRSMNRFGDMLVDASPVYRGNVAYTNGSVSDHAVAMLRQIQTDLKNKGAELFLTWPTTLTNPQFDLAKEEVRKRVGSVKKLLVAGGLDIHCRAEDFHFPRDLFFDTHYHLNARGAFYRTAALAKCMGFDGSLDPEAEYRLARSQAAVFDQRRAAIADSYVAEVEEDISIIAAALEAYRTDQGHYPRMPQWAGIRSAWGPSTSDWIPGLAPRYIPALPTEPRQSANPRQQYIYRSDGNDFKLLAHDPSHCDAFLLAAPYSIDPKRGCGAVGRWTAGAWTW